MLGSLCLSLSYIKLYVYRETEYDNAKREIEIPRTCIIRAGPQITPNWCPSLSLSDQTGKCATARSIYSCDRSLSLSLSLSLFLYSIYLSLSLSHSLSLSLSFPIFGKRTLMNFEERHQCFLHSHVRGTNDVWLFIKHYLSYDSYKLSLAWLLGSLSLPLSWIYIYIYIYIHISKYWCVYHFVYIYIYTYLYIYIYIYVCICVYIYICMCVERDIYIDTYIYIYRERERERERERKINRECKTPNWKTNKTKK